MIRINSNLISNMRQSSPKATIFKQMVKPHSFVIPSVKSNASSSPSSRCDRRLSSPKKQTMVSNSRHNNSNSSSTNHRNTNHSMTTSTTASRANSSTNATIGRSDGGGIVIRDGGGGRNSNTNGGGGGNSSVDNNSNHQYIPSATRAATTPAVLASATPAASATARTSSSSSSSRHHAVTTPAVTPAGGSSILEDLATTSIGMNRTGQRGDPLYVTNTSRQQHHTTTTTTGDGRLSWDPTRSNTSTTNRTAMNLLVPPSRGGTSTSTNHTNHRGDHDDYVDYDDGERTRTTRPSSTSSHHHHQQQQSKQQQPQSQQPVHQKQQQYSTTSKDALDNNSSTSSSSHQHHHNQPQGDALPRPPSLLNGWRNNATAMIVGVQSESFFGHTMNNILADDSMDGDISMNTATTTTTMTTMMTTNNPSRRLWKVSDSNLPMIPLFYPPMNPYCCVCIMDTPPSVIAIRITECLKQRNCSVEYDEETATALVLTIDRCYFNIHLWKYIPSKTSTTATKSTSSSKRSHHPPPGVLVECIRISSGQVHTFHQTAQVVLQSAQGLDNGKDRRGYHQSYLSTPIEYPRLLSSMMKTTTTTSEKQQQSNRTATGLLDPMFLSTTTSVIVMEVLQHSVYDLLNQNLWEIQQLGMEYLVSLTDPSHYGSSKRSDNGSSTKTATTKTNFNNGNHQNDMDNGINNNDDDECTNDDIVALFTCLTILGGTPAMYNHAFGIDKNNSKVNNPASNNSYYYGFLSELHRNWIIRLIVDRTIPPVSALVSSSSSSTPRHQNRGEATGSNRLTKPSMITSHQNHHYDNTTNFLFQSCANSLLRGGGGGGSGTAKSNDHDEYEEETAEEEEANDDNIHAHLLPPASSRGKVHQNHQNRHSSSSHSFPSEPSSSASAPPLNAIRNKKKQQQLHDIAHRFHTNGDNVGEKDFYDPLNHVSTMRALALRAFTNALLFLSRPQYNAFLRMILSGKNSNGMTSSSSTSSSSLWRHVTYALTEDLQGASRPPSVAYAGTCLSSQHDAVLATICLGILGQYSTEARQVIFTGGHGGGGNSAAAAGDTPTLALLERARTVGRATHTLLGIVATKAFQELTEDERSC